MGELKNFLRNNFRPGEWLGQFCTPRQHNRIANVLQGIQGVNCRIEKPTNHEGRDWRVIIDGGSDVSTDITPPWVSGDFNRDQWKVIKGITSDTFRLCGGVWNRTVFTNYADPGDPIVMKPAHSVIIPEASWGDVSWASLRDAETELSNNIAVTEDCELWAKLDWSSSGSERLGFFLVADADIPIAETAGIYLVKIATFKMDGAKIDWKLFRQHHTGSFFTVDYGTPEECDT